MRLSVFRLDCPQIGADEGCAGEGTLTGFF